MKISKIIFKFKLLKAKSWRQIRKKLRNTLDRYRHQVKYI